MKVKIWLTNGPINLERSLLLAIEIEIEIEMSRENENASLRRRRRRRRLRRRGIAHNKHKPARRTGGGGRHGKLRKRANPFLVKPYRKLK